MECSLGSVKAWSSSGRNAREGTSSFDGLPFLALLDFLMPDSSVHDHGQRLRIWLSVIAV